MARPGFVLEVDERTPPLVVADGIRFRTERFPLGTSVVYPAERLPAVGDVAEAIDAALDAPLDSPPLQSRLRPGMRLAITVDDLTTPVPPMAQPDLRGRIVEAVLRRAASAGVDDVELVAARGLNRRLTDAELRHLLGERVFRSFAEGHLVNSDAEDTDRLTRIGTTEQGEVLLDANAAAADLLVHVRLAGPAGNGTAAVARGLGSTATIAQLAARPDGSSPSAGELEHLLTEAVDTFVVEAVLDNTAYAPSLEFLGRREWEWSLQDQAAWFAVRGAQTVTRAVARRRAARPTRARYGAVQIAAGEPSAVSRASATAVAAQRIVEVRGQADVAVLGVGPTSPYSIDSVTNPVLAAWQALGAGFGAHTGQPVVRPGGALIVYHPMRPDFSPLHHPSYVDFFADVLPTTTDAEQIADKFEQRYATDPWYRHLYQTSYACHGLQPMHRWYEMEPARRHCTDVIWVGGHRPTVERLGFRAASTLADALEIVSSTVGRAPAITYLHDTSHLLADVR